MSRLTPDRGKQPTQKGNQPQPDSPREQINARLRQRTSPEDKAKEEQQARLSEARKYLASKNLLAESAPCNPYTIAHTILTMATTLKLPAEAKKTIAHLGEVALTIEMHCLGCTRASELPELLENTRTSIQQDLDAKLEKLNQTLGMRTPTQPDTGDSAKKLEEVVKNLDALSTEIGAKVAKVSDSSTQLESTAKSYRDALLKMPPQVQKDAQVARNPVNPEVGKIADRKARQILIEMQDGEAIMLSTDAIKEKLEQIIKQVTVPAPPEDTTILEVTKMRKSGIIILFQSREMVDWIHQPDVEIDVTANFAAGSSIKQRQYAILVPRIPLTFDPGNSTCLRELEEQNGLAKDVISKARWIKPEYRRSPEQRVAHASFLLNNAAAANYCIKNGLLICSVKVYPAKLKQEPTQCMKCRKWGHFAGDCTQARDTCGTCGGEHRTNNCTVKDRRYCVSCRSNTHASWDRNCPEFAKRCGWHDEKHPENTLRFFPTDDTWTQAARPVKIPIPERFPAKYAVGSLPPANKNGRELPTREIGKRPKRNKSKGKQPQNQTTLDGFLEGKQGGAENTPDLEEGEISTESEDAISADLLNNSETSSVIFTD